MKYTQRGRVTAFFLLMTWVNMTFGFVTVVNSFPARQQHTNNWSVKSLAAATTASDTVDADEVVARRIVVVGDVHGGYYRSCVRNEASRFRRLVGNMTPSDESSKEAEIYVEGKRKMVDGFIRWCQRSNVGLSQVVTVKEVRDEEPTGLYEDFYVQS